MVPLESPHPHGGRRIVESAEAVAAVPKRIVGRRGRGRGRGRVRPDVRRAASAAVDVRAELSPGVARRGLEELFLELALRLHRGYTRPSEEARGSACHHVLATKNSPTFLEFRSFAVVEQSVPPILS